MYLFSSSIYRSYSLITWYFSLSLLISTLSLSTLLISLSKYSLTIACLVLSCSIEYSYLSSVSPLAYISPCIGFINCTFSVLDLKSRYPESDSRARPRKRSGVSFMSRNFSANFESLSRQERGHEIAFLSRWFKSLCLNWYSSHFSSQRRSLMSKSRSLLVNCLSLKSNSDFSLNLCISISDCLTSKLFSLSMRSLKPRSVYVSQDYCFNTDFR